MNKEWSEMNKAMQLQLKKKVTYEAGIKTLFELRAELMLFMRKLKEEFQPEEFYAMPFMNHKGYESKTLAYSLFHVFRIEDIVANTLIQKREEVFFKEDYPKRMNSAILTTGNELVKEQIADFSSKLDLDNLYHYITDVYEETNQMLLELPYERLKEKMTEADKEAIKNLGVVSEDDNAVWLIDYWCGKDIKGLIQMPLSRHWIMHMEACSRIATKLKKEL
ncbi:MAG: phage head-tail adapter protein [Clostridiales bacterium]|nr:phage head-tail adapter protein [Clostridiales bacterium]